VEACPNRGVDSEDFSMTHLRFWGSALIALAVLALSACGATSSPADNLNFKAPSGWQSSPGIMGFMQFWKAPTSDNEVLMLFKSPRPLKTSDVFNSANLKDAKVEAQQAIVICGAQPAVFFKAQATGSKGADSNVEMVKTDAAGTTYMAMYVYPAGAQPNSDAVAALRELCAKP
jgi:hypothetical protein